MATHDPAVANRRVHQVEIFMGDNNPTDGIGGYKAFEMNIRRAIETPEAAQRNAYYAAAICNLIPSLTSTMEEACRVLGYRVTKRILPRDAETMIPRVDMDNIINSAKAVAMWGLLVIMLYKNPSAEFCRRRMRALMGRAGVIEEGELEVFPNVEAARAFRSTFGENAQVRKNTLLSVLGIGSDHGSMSWVCYYIRSLLEWTDLSGYYLVLTTLVQSPSTLLKHEPLQGEVRNFDNATRTIEASQMPAYFRILEDPSLLGWVFERRRFPMLVAVAQAIKSWSTRIEEESVKSLVDLHYSLQSPVLDREMQRMINYLTENPEEDED